MRRKRSGLTWHVERVERILKELQAHARWSSYQSLILNARGKTRRSRTRSRLGNLQAARAAHLILIDSDVIIDLLVINTRDVTVEGSVK